MQREWGEHILTCPAPLSLLTKLSPLPVSTQAARRGSRNDAKIMALTQRRDCRNFSVSHYSTYPSRRPPSMVPPPDSPTKSEFENLEMGGKRWRGPWEMKTNLPATEWRSRSEPACQFLPPLSSLCLPSFLPSRHASHAAIITRRDRATSFLARVRPSLI